jgi:hypothetical protein
MLHRSAGARRLALCFFILLQPRCLDSRHPRVHERFEPIRIFSDCLKLLDRRTDIRVRQFRVMIMPPPANNQICKARRLHDPNLNAIT